MAFSGFSGDALALLFENRARDSREWYRENKARFDSLVRTPLKELAAELLPPMREIDPKLGCAVSRVCRDARFSRDKSLFRDHMWVSFVRDRSRQGELPCFFFELNQSGFLYGCGFYKTPRPVMESIRSLILAGDRAFREADGAFSRQNVFTLEGECYKRPHFPDRPERERIWLERKEVGFVCRSSDFGTLFSPALSDVLLSGFRLLRPAYEFFRRAEELAPRREQEHETRRFTAT